MVPRLSSGSWGLGESDDLVGAEYLAPMCEKGQLWTLDKLVRNDRFPIINRTFTVGNLNDRFWPIPAIGARILLLCET